MAATIKPSRSLPITLRGARVDLRAESFGQSQCRYAIVRRSDGQRVGDLRMTVEGTSVTITSLCIDPSVRGYGAGSDAARTLCAAAAAAGFERLRASAPGNFGLAVYFWIRHGFRPLFGLGPDEGIWFERRLRPAKE